MVNAGSDIERHLARHVATLSAHSLPTDVHTAFDRLLVDYVAVVLAGAGDDGCRRAAHSFAKLGGKPESSVIGLDRAVPAPWAAFAQGVCAHWFDWDDTHDESHVHGGAVIFPVLFALAESRAARGDACSLDEFVATVVAAYDIACRLGGFLKHNASRGWMPTGSGATIGAAAAGARISGLNEEGILSAMGIAASNCGLSRQALADKTNAKGTLAGVAAKSAAEAVMLAEAGVQGPPHFITGTYGLHSLHAQRSGDPTSMLQDFGSRFSIGEVSTKPYPCCRSTHAVVDTVLAFREEEPAFAADVESMSAFVPGGVFERCGAPFAVGTDPRLDAQFSIPYTAAVALRRGRLSLSDFSASTVMANSTELRPLIDSITVAPDRNLAGDSMAPVVVQFKSKDRTLERTTMHVKGEPCFRLTPEEGSEKLRCATHGMVAPHRLADIERLARSVGVDGPLELSRRLRSLGELIIALS